MPDQRMLPPVGTIAATDRKESAQDSEVICGYSTSSTTGVLPSNPINLFQSYTSFQNTSSQTGIEQKQKGRDTTLSGPGGGLPQGYQLLWFEWRAGPRTLGANLNTPQFAGVSEQLERIRENGFIKAVFSQSPLITANLRDLVSFTDARFIQTTVPNTTVMAPCISQRGGKVVVTGNEPYKIVGLEQLEMQAGWPGASQVGAYQGGPFLALVPYYLFCSLDGVMSRASL